MSRPIKNGLDYFPMDVDTDEKFELIEAKHGLIGFGVVVKILQRIYKSGYFLEWNEEKLLIFKKAINVDINLINDIINDCLRYNIFDQLLFKKYKILTSNGIQKRFLGACDRRKSVELVKNYIIADINSVNVNINWINDNISTQSKVKESKEDNTPLPPEGEFLKTLPSGWRELIKIWLDHKSAKRQKYKDVKQLEVMYQKLVKLSGNDLETASEIIENSIAFNYSGFFKQNKNQNGAIKRNNKGIDIDGIVNAVFEANGM